MTAQVHTVSSAKDRVGTAKATLSEQSTAGVISSTTRSRDASFRNRFILFILHENCTKKQSPLRCLDVLGTILAPIASGSASANCGLPHLGELQIFSMRRVRLKVQSCWNRQEVATYTFFPWDYNSRSSPGQLKNSSASQPAICTFKVPVTWCYMWLLRHDVSSVRKRLALLPVNHPFVKWW